MAWTLCSSYAAINKAGANANASVVASGSILEEWSEEVEGYICAECHTDFVTNYSSLETGIQRALAEVSSSMIASNIIFYDMSGYTDRREAETILDVLDERITTGLNTLKDKKKQRLSE